MLVTIQTRTLFSLLLSKNVKNRTYKNCKFSCVLYGYEIWSLILSEEHRQRVFAKRVLRRIFGPMRDEVTGGWKNCVMKKFITYTLLQVKLEWTS
jgi:hypothetical protein